MPCDSIRTISVDLSSVGRINPDLMLAALNDLHLGAFIRSVDKGRIHFGRGEWIDVATGQSQFASSRDVNEIKQAYGAAVVRDTARRFARFGWVTKQVDQPAWAVRRVS